MTAALEVARRARDDVGFFADRLVGEPLWPHQLEAATSPARIRVLRAGRQVGKSRLLAVLALHEAFKAPDRHVLLLSAGDDSAKDLLAEVTALATGAPLLAGSIEDESLSRVVLSNGSWVRSIPASAKQARGKSIDLLVIDEACFVDEEVWRAAKYSMAARPGSRLLLSSSPYGPRDRFFAVHDQMAAHGPVSIEGVSVEGFVWPSTISPLVQAAGLIEFWRRTDPPRTFAAEVMAEWQDDVGAYFSAEELDGAVAPYGLIRPGVGERGAWGQGRVVGGIDWGMRVDAHALVVLGVLADGGRNVEQCGREPVFFVPWLESHARMPYHRFIDRVLDVADQGHKGFEIRYLVSETNGVGQAPTETLTWQAWQRGLGTKVAGVHTDSRRKESAFGAIKLLLQQGRLVVPRHPELLKQLAALQFEERESGLTRISVPERLGHDDVAMGLAQAVSAVRTSVGRSWVPPDAPGDDAGDELTTGRGTVVWERPRCWDLPAALRPPAGEQDGDGW